MGYNGENGETVEIHLFRISFIYKTKLKFYDLFCKKTTNKQTEQKKKHKKTVNFEITKPPLL